MLKIYKRGCNFVTKLCDLIKNYLHNGKIQPRQEVEEGYIFVNIFVKNLNI